MKTATEITVYPSAGHKIAGGKKARPFSRKATRTWRKQVSGLLATTPGASHAIVEFDDETSVRISK